MDSKVCTKCKREKPLSEFHQRKDGYYQSSCYACMTLKTKAWIKANPFYHKQGRVKLRLKKSFNMTPEEYNDYFIRQEGKCAICGTHQKDLTSLLAVDHNHTTGTIRGLLCRLCNQGLGHFKDDPGLTKKATEYLLTNNN